MTDLAWLHLTRHRQRHALAVVSAAFSALVLTFSLIIGQGVPGGSYAPARMLLGGDVVVLPDMPAVPEAGAPGGGGWTLDWTSVDREDPYTLFDPRRLDLPRPTRKPSGGADWAGLGERLAAEPGVAAVVPYLTMPAYLVADAPGGAGQLRVRVDLRARIPAEDAVLGLPRAILSGRALAPSDDGRLVALVDGTRPDFEREPRDSYYAYDRFNGRWVFWDRDRPMIVPLAPPAPGDVLRLALPTWRDGVPDYAAARDVSLDVVGTFALKESVWPWSGYSLNPEGLELTGRPKPVPWEPYRYFDEPRALSIPQVFIPLATWQALARRTGLSGDAAAPAAWILRVRDTSSVNALVNELQRRYPGRLILSVADLDEGHPLAIAPTLATPHDDIQTVAVRGAEPDAPTPRAPAWVGSWLAGIATAMGMALFFANVFVLFYTRQKELATLRVLGASRGQVAGLVMAEVFLVAFTGVAAGFLLSLPILAYQAGSGGGAGAVLSKVAQDAAIDLGVAVAAAILLGGLLGVWASRRNPWGALKVE